MSAEDKPLKLAGEKDAGKTITLEREETLRIVLPENPTAGYRWRLDRNPGLLELKQSRFRPAAPRRSGAAGERIFEFSSRRGGRARIFFSYLRTWEKRSLKKVSFAIEVRP